MDIWEGPTLTDMPKRLPSICFLAPHAYAVLVGDDSIESIGGAEAQQVIVARGLVERGYAVSFICLDFGQKAEIEMEGIKVFRAYRLDDGLPGLRFVWPRLTSIWKCLQRADADIYYQRTASRLTGIMAAYCRHMGRKSIFAAAGNPDLEANTPRIRHWRDRKIYEFGLRHVDQILVQNNEQARLCRHTLGRDPILIPNCYPPPNRTSRGRGDYILWVSMIRQLKRPELLLDLAESCPEYRFRMVGGPGRGEESVFDEVRARASCIPNVEFLGFVPFSRIDKHFEDAALVVNTSESEGFPNTFLQAWSRGIPTVSFIDAGARLNGEPVGIIVNSIYDMTRAIGKLFPDGPTRNRESGRCLAYFQSHHSPSSVLDLYETLFFALCPSIDGGHAYG
jgi:glycosyltransferase involved in cell wall biosynthesis